MPLMNLVVALIVVGDGVVAGQSLYPDGFQHQDDSEYRRRDGSGSFRFESPRDFGATLPVSESGTNWSVPVVHPYEAKHEE